MFRLACALVIAGFTVAGCTIGEGAGAIIGAVIGLSIVEAALIGAGGLTGMLTNGSQANLGDPLWKKKQRQKSTGMVHSIPIDLGTLGYDPGPADGKTGQKTTDAIIRYRRDLPTGKRKPRARRGELPIPT